jgi:hypothetical protein
MENMQMVEMNYTELLDAIAEQASKNIILKSDIERLSLILKGK